MLKKILITFLLLPCVAFGQQQVFKIAKQKPVLKSLLSYSNGIYAGVPNSFVFTDSTQSPKNYYISAYTKRDTLQVDNEESRIIISCQSIGDIGDSATVFIYHITKKDTELSNV